MSKLPVFRTFGNALGFTLFNFLTIFRLTWLPVVAMMAATFGVGFAIEEMAPLGAMSGTPLGPKWIGEHFQEFIGVQIATMLLQAIAVTAIAVAVHRVILFGDRKPDHYFVFAFGKTEFLYLMMGVLTVIIILTVMGAILAPVAFLVTNGDFGGFFDRFKNWPENAPEVMMSGALTPLIAAYAVGWLILLFVMVRLAVWPPAVVATRRLSPAEPWALTRGNFWRFIGLFLLTAIAVWMVVVPATAAYFFYHARELMPHQQTVEAVKDPVAMREAMRVSIRPYWPTILLGYFLIYMFFTAFGVALLSFSYKALKGYDAAGPIPEEG